MAIEYGALLTELQTDPNGYGYAPLIAAGSDGELANLLNQLRSTISVPRSDVPPLEILEAMNVSDFVSTANSLSGTWLNALLQYPSIRILKTDGTDTRVLSNIMKILSNGSASETRIRALATRIGSRSEQLFGVAVTPNDIGEALRMS